jgi:hypothetical protein
LIDLLLLEGCSASSITIPYLFCIAFGTWLGFAGEAKQSGGEAEGSARRRGARGGGEREAEGSARRRGSARLGARSGAKSAGSWCDKDRGAALRICFIKIDSPFGL